MSRIPVKCGNIIEDKSKLGIAKAGFRPPLQDSGEKQVRAKKNDPIVKSGRWSDLHHIWWQNFSQGRCIATPGAA